MLHLGLPPGSLCSAIFAVRRMCDLFLYLNTVSFLCCSACNFSVLCSITVRQAATVSAVQSAWVFLTLWEPCCYIRLSQIASCLMSFAETLASYCDVYDSLSSVKVLPSVVIRSIFQFSWLSFCAATVIPAVPQKTCILSFRSLLP